MVVEPHIWRTFFWFSEQEDSTAKTETARQIAIKMIFLFIHHLFTFFADLIQVILSRSEVRFLPEDNFFPANRLSTVRKILNILIRRSVKRQERDPSGTNQSIFLNMRPMMIPPTIAVMGATITKPILPTRVRMISAATIFILSIRMRLGSLTLKTNSRVR